MAEFKTAAFLAVLFLVFYGLIKLYGLAVNKSGKDKATGKAAGIVSTVLVYVYGAALATLNLTNIFDRVVWGDEGWSARMGSLSYSGIWFMVKTYDTHPPFYYLWLHTFEVILGQKGWVMHLASFVPFLAVMVFTAIVLRKVMGNLPTALMMTIIALSAHSVEYNVEIRMYSLAAAALIFALYSCYKVFEGKRLMWIAAVVFSLVGAYSHYYAMMSCGLMLAFAALMMFIRKGLKDGLIGCGAVAAYIIGYIPWMPYLFGQTGSVSDNWWNDELMSVTDALRYIGGGPGYWLIVLGTLAVSLVLVVVIMAVKHVKIKSASPEIYAVALACLTILSTLAAAYVMCVIVAPILVDRYLYPLITLAAFALAMTAAVAIGYLVKAQKTKRNVLVKELYTALLLAVLVMLAYRGYLNLRSFSNVSRVESQQTEKTLATIGEAGDDIYFVSNGVKHIGWTVLPYYYNGKEVTSADCFGVSYDKFWYFSPDELSDEQLSSMEERGYSATKYGVNQLAKYLFHMYYFEK